MKHFPYALTEGLSGKNLKQSRKLGLNISCQVHSNKSFRVFTFVQDYSCDKKFADQVKDMIMLDVLGDMNVVSI